MSLYRGFSTDNRLRKYRVTDFDLAKQDLFNHFRIRKGEKLMNPKFGTIIWDLLFEPLTEEVRDLIVEDIKNVVNYDPRLQADDVVITEYDHGIQVELELRYVLTNESATLALQFDRMSKTLTSIG